MSEVIKMLNTEELRSICAEVGADPSKAIALLYIIAHRPKSEMSIVQWLITEQDRVEKVRSNKAAAKEAAIAEARRRKYGAGT